MGRSENCKRKFPEREDEFLTLKLSSNSPPIVSESPPPAEHTFLPPSLPFTTAAAEQRVSPSISTTMETLVSQAPPQIPFQFPLTHSLCALPPPFMPVSPTPPSVSNNNLISKPRRNSSRNTSSKKTREGKGETVPISFPWATDRRAMVRDLKYLLQRQIFTITGNVQCKKCEREYEMGLDLQSKFAEIENFIAENKSSMHDRAPSVWMYPVLPNCRYCHEENSVKPVLAEKKRSINWLFLLLGQMLGCCTLEHLKYFCKHTDNHRTGAKDRVLYLTYLGLCKQLDPKDLFER
ncbi:hypothetical protein L6164_035583 [Bauhinia variegata]|uniref:Uncharacterized protein n=1 Tax=Bauhinia variegata TaxID=167791 RepID=A0ACB9KEH7_BAUVA|nr:hypothetical protein L6164_035583 [Bauhinia variegata]